MLSLFNMDESRVRKLNILIGVVVGAAVGLSIVQKNYLLAFIAVIVGLILTRFIKSKARIEGVVLEDERVELIASKASDRTLRFVALLLVIIGFVLKALNNSLGDILLYIGCLMLIVYLVFYRYYALKFGGA
jgi:uncharacterized membrane protein